MDDKENLVTESSSDDDEAGMNELWYTIPWVLWTYVQVVSVSLLLSRLRSEPPCLLI